MPATWATIAPNKSLTMLSRPADSRPHGLSWIMLIAWTVRSLFLSSGGKCCRALRPASTVNLFENERGWAMVSQPYVISAGFAKVHPVSVAADFPVVSLIECSPKEPDMPRLSFNTIAPLTKTQGQGYSDRAPQQNLRGGFRSPNDHRRDSANAITGAFFVPVSVRPVYPEPLHGRSCGEASCLPGSYVPGLRTLHGLPPFFRFAAVGGSSLTDVWSTTL